MSINSFKSWLLQPPAKPPIGSWVQSGAPAVAEAMGMCGFDFLVVDMEHSPIGIAEAVSLLRAIACTPAEPVVRLPWNDQIMVKRMLDAGARNLMFPFVQSAEEARAAVSYTRYPPQGVRGVASLHRGSRYGHTSDYLETANDSITVVVQIETPEALERLPQIATVPGVDSLFLGPADLSAALGRIGAIDHPEVQTLIAGAPQSAHSVGKSIGIIAGNPDGLRRFMSYGYDWGAVGSDLSLLRGRAVECVTALKGGPQR